MENILSMPSQQTTFVSSIFDILLYNEQSHKVHGHPPARKLKPWLKGINLNT